MSYMIKIAGRSTDVLDDSANVELPRDGVHTDGYRRSGAHILQHLGLVLRSGDV